MQPQATINHNLTELELNFIREGTEARRDKTFSSWPSEDTERYWRLVNEFNPLYSEQR